MPNSAEDLDVMFADAMEADAAAEVVADLTEDEPVAESDGDIEIVETEIDTPDVDVEADAETEDGTGEEVWNWEDFSDQLVPIVVDGETQMVPLKELREGNMRHADYTRKTQEVAAARAELDAAKDKAQWADAVQAAFERDPMGTLQALAQAYGVQRDGVESDQVSSLETLDDDIRPWAEKAQSAEQRALEMEQRLAALETDRIKAEINAELAQMKAEFGESFDPVAVLRHAADNAVSLEEAHWAIQGRRSWEASRTQQQVDSQAEQAAAAAAAQAEANRQKAKSKASSAATKTFKASDIEPDDFNDIGELMEQLMASQ